LGLDLYPVLLKTRGGFVETLGFCFFLVVSFPTMDKSSVPLVGPWWVATSVLPSLLYTTRGSVGFSNHLGKECLPPDPPIPAWVPPNANHAPGGFPRIFRGVFLWFFRVRVFFPPPPPRPFPPHPPDPVLLFGGVLFPEGRSRQVGVVTSGKKPPPPPNKTPL